MSNALLNGLTGWYVYVLCRQGKAIEDFASLTESFPTVRFQTVRLSTKFQNESQIMPTKYHLRRIQKAHSHIEFDIETVSLLMNEILS